MDSRVKIKNKDNISQAEANVKAKLAHFSYQKSLQVPLVFVNQIQFHPFNQVFLFISFCTDSMKATKFKLN